MRKLILFGLLTGLTLPGFGETPATTQRELVTVELLEQRLAAATSTHHKDTDPAHQIDGDTDLLRQLDEDVVQAPQIENLELTERLTPTRRTRILAKYEFGPETEHALQLLADRSSFLDPPASELPPTPLPDEDTQQRILEQARHYVFHVLTHLPDFFATRTTAHYDNDPTGPAGFARFNKGGLRLEETVNHEITFRDGKEMTDPLPSGAMIPIASTPAQKVTGMDSWGEFGLELVVVLTDTGKGTLTFHHWEKTQYGLAAVYRYSVPEVASHYEVNYSCRAKKPFHSNPSYHGTLSIDPASGAVLRVTLETDSGKSDPIAHLASVIEYGPVMIGDRRYLCPLRSLTFMDEMPNACIRRDKKHQMLQPLATFNRTSFSHYHRLGTSIRLIPEKPGAGISAPSLADATPPQSEAKPDATSAPSLAPFPSTSPAQPSSLPSATTAVASDVPAVPIETSTGAKGEASLAAVPGSAQSMIPGPASSLLPASSAPKQTASQPPVAQPTYKGILPKPSSPYRINLE